jgi:hypothetical protein
MFKLKLIRGCSEKWRNLLLPYKDKHVCCYITFDPIHHLTVITKKYRGNPYLGVVEFVFYVLSFMVFNATINNISFISWLSVLLVEDTGVPGENHRPSASHWQTVSHNVVHLALRAIRTHNISGGRHILHRTNDR